MLDMIKGMFTALVAVVVIRLGVEVLFAAAGL